MSKVAILAKDISNFTGMTNFLRRIGVGFSCFQDLKNFLNNDSFNIVFIGNGYWFKDEDKEQFKNWISRNIDTNIFCFGYNNIIENIFETTAYKCKTINPYWPILITFRDKKHLISLPGYEYIKIEKNDNILVKYQLHTGEGYFLSPSYTKIKDIKDNYLVYQKKNFMLFSLPVFELLGDIFLGKLWIDDYKNWYNPLFWLEEFISNIKKIIEERIDQELNPAEGWVVDDNYSGIVVLRHDVDSSTDLSYLKYELQNQIPATYAVLLDKNKEFWLSELKDKRNIEISYHYNTINNLSTLKKIFRLFHKNPRILQYKPITKGITQSGLYKQYIKAKKEKIYARTLNRHGPFLIFPDYYYAMEYLCQKEPEVLGSGSLFRGIILNTGADRPDGISGYIGAFPGTIIPYWYPIKPFLEIRGKNRPSSFWESTHLMETDQAIIDSVLDEKDSISGKPIYTFNFHPAHATKETFNEKGCFSWFKYLVDKAQKLNFKFLTLAGVYERMNEWEEKNA